MNKEYEKNISLWNAGYCKYVQHYGNDDTPLIAARMSTLNPTGVDKIKDNNLRDFLWRKGHVSVFEQAGLTVEIQVPLFIARQVLRHKSLHPNEFSMRYSEPIFEYYVPEEDAVCYDNEFNKQMSGQPVEENLAKEYINSLKDESVLNRAKYEKWRKRGLAKERVRDSQPVNSYTRLMITANLRDWFFFLHKRLKQDAQREIRELSEAIYSILKDLFPLCCDTFDENTRYAENASKTEIVVIREWIKMVPHLEDPNNEAVFDNLAEKLGLNKSRTRELKEKFKLF